MLFSINDFYIALIKSSKNEILIQFCEGFHHYQMENVVVDDSSNKYSCILNSKNIRTINKQLRTNK